MGKVDLDLGATIPAELVLEDEVAGACKIAVHGSVAKAAVIGRIEGGHDLLGQGSGQVSQGGTRVENDRRGVDAVVLGDTAGIAIDGSDGGQGDGEGGVVVGGGILDDGHSDQIARVLVRVNTTEEDGTCRRREVILRLLSA